MTQKLIRKRKGKYQYWKSEYDGQYYFHLVSGNGEVTAPSEAYTTKQGVLKGIETNRELVATASVEQIVPPQKGKRTKVLKPVSREKVER